MLITTVLQMGKSRVSRSGVSVDLITLIQNDKLNDLLRWENASGQVIKAVHLHFQFTALVVPTVELHYTLILTQTKTVSALNWELYSLQGPGTLVLVVTIIIIPIVHKLQQSIWKWMQR